MFTMMNPTLIAALVGLVLGFGGGWASNGWKLEAEIARMQAQGAVDLANSLKDALDQTVRFQRTKDEAIKKAESRAAANAASAATARTESERLRDMLAANSGAIPRATHASLQSYATTLSDVYGECVSKYQSLGAEADKYTSDLRTLTDAWPKKDTK